MKTCCVEVNRVGQFAAGCILKMEFVGAGTEKNQRITVDDRSLPSCDPFLVSKAGAWMERGLGQIPAG